MRLTDEQLETFDTEGYVFLPEVFSKAEIDVLMGEVPGIFALDRVENVREKTGKSVRTTFAAHVLPGTKSPLSLPHSHFFGDDTFDPEDAASYLRALLAG